MLFDYPYLESKIDVNYFYFRYYWGHIHYYSDCGKKVFTASMKRHWLQWSAYQFACVRLPKGFM